MRIHWLIQYLDYKLNIWFVVVVPQICHGEFCEMNKQYKIFILWNLNSYFPVIWLNENWNKYYIKLNGISQCGRVKVCQSDEKKRHNYKKTKLISK